MTERPRRRIDRLSEGSRSFFFPKKASSQRVLGDLLSSISPLGIALSVLSATHHGRPRVRTDRNLPYSSVTCCLPCLCLLLTSLDGRLSVKMAGRISLSLSSAAFLPSPSVSDRAVVETRTYTLRVKLGSRCSFLASLDAKLPKKRVL